MGSKKRRSRDFVGPDRRRGEVPSQRAHPNCWGGPGERESGFPFPRGVWEWSGRCSTQEGSVSNPCSCSGGEPSGGTSGASPRIVSVPITTSCRRRLSTGDVGEV